MMKVNNPYKIHNFHLMEIFRFLKQHLEDIKTKPIYSMQLSKNKSTSKIWIYLVHEYIINVLSMQ